MRESVFSGPIDLAALGIGVVAGLALLWAADIIISRRRERHLHHLLGQELHQHADVPLRELMTKGWQVGLFGPVSVIIEARPTNANHLKKLRDDIEQAQRFLAELKTLPADAWARSAEQATRVRDAMGNGAAS